MADTRTRTYDPAALPHWFRWFVALVVFLPLAFVGWRATDTMHNIPMWDEFERGVIDSVIAPTGRGKSFSQHAAEVSGKPMH
jgi:hypothetical protein